MRYSVECRDNRYRLLRRLGFRRRADAVNYAASNAYGMTCHYATVYDRWRVLAGYRWSDDPVLSPIAQWQQVC